MFTFTKAEMLSMLLKTKPQISKAIVEKLKDTDEIPSDAYSSSSTRLSGESSQSPKRRKTQSLHKAGSKTVDAVDYAVDDAIRRSAGKAERQWLEKRNKD